MNSSQILILRMLQWRKQHTQLFKAFSAANVWSIWNILSSWLVRSLKISQVWIKQQIVWTPVEMCLLLSGGSVILWMHPNMRGTDVRTKPVIRELHLPFSVNRVFVWEQTCLWGSWISWSVLLLNHFKWEKQRNVANFNQFLSDAYLIFFLCVCWHNNKQLRSLLYNFNPFMLHGFTQTLMLAQ